MLTRTAFLTALAACSAATLGAATFDYRVLATNKTSTMQKELKEAGEAGFRLLGMTVAKTAMGGSELVCILRKD